MNLLEEYEALKASLEAAQAEMEAAREEFLAMEDIEGLATQAVSSTVRAKADPQAHKPPTREGLVLTISGLDAQFPLEGIVTIGRSQECGLFLADPRASREHAQITEREDEYWIADLNSSNGVYVNEKQISEPVQLRPGDEIQIGDTRLVVRMSHPESAADATMIDAPESAQTLVQPAQFEEALAKKEVTRLCHQCQQPLTSTTSFCNQCGAPVMQNCQQCGGLIAKGARFCPHCGAMGSQE